MRKSLLLLLLFCLTANAWKWQDLWQTPDQQAAAVMAKGEHAQAAKLFQSKDWRGAANYRANNFDQAVKDFSQNDDVTSLYNRGNALAHLHKYQDAIEDYERVLKMNPDHVDARHNRDLIKKLLQKQEQQQKNKDSQQKKDQKDQQDQKKNQDNKDQNEKDQQSSQSKDQQKNQDDKKNQNNQSQQPEQEQQNQQDKSKQQDEKDQKKDKEQQQTEPKKQQSQLDKEKQEKKNQQQQQAAGDQEQQPPPQDQADKQWLQQIPDDPGGLLRRKFMRDYQRRLEERG